MGRDGMVVGPGLAPGEEIVEGGSVLREDSGLFRQSFSNSSKPGVEGFKFGFEESGDVLNGDGIIKVFVEFVKRLQSFQRPKASGVFDPAEPTTALILSGDGPGNGDVGWKCKNGRHDEPKHRRSLRRSLR